MYEISNASRYSYFSLSDDKVKYEPVVTYKEVDHLSNIKSQISEIENQIKFLENQYVHVINERQHANPYTNIESQSEFMDRVSSINSQIRQLNDKKLELNEQFKFYSQTKLKNQNVESLSNSSNSFHQNENCDKYQNKTGPVLTSLQAPPEIRKVIFWSLDLFNHTSSRILNKQKYLSPGSLLRHTNSSYGLYNYTYFNDQPPEEIEIFDYKVVPPQSSSSIPPSTSSVSMTTTGPPKPIVPAALTQFPVPKPVVTTMVSSIPAGFVGHHPHLVTTRPPPPPVMPVVMAAVPKPIPVQPVVQPIQSSRVLCISDIINRSVDSRHVIILRGLPGSGKSTFCQAFKEKELANGRSAPRILSVDGFFVEDGKFEYDPDLEPKYRHELFKLFKRQIDEGFFTVIVLDCIHERLEQFSQFYQYAKVSRFQVSVLELKVSPTICAKRSEDRFTPAQVYRMADAWEETPPCYDKLDATSFLQDSAIEDVEMEDVEVAEDKPDSAVVSRDDDDDEEDEDEDSLSETGFFKSKWDEDFEDTKERLDGVKAGAGHDAVPEALSLREYLRVELDNLNKATSGAATSTAKRSIKWADFEELKKQKRRKELGFVAGNTDWAKLMASDLEVAEAALVQVRYFTKDAS